MTKEMVTVVTAGKTAFQKNRFISQRFFALITLLIFSVISSSAWTYGNKIDGHEYVDLGLPSGLLWATCNVGAYKPYLSGKYFAWGEVKPKSSYTEENCLSYNKQIPYDISGLQTYDAATANWGKRWRTPTLEEFQELLDNCKIRYVTFRKDKILIAEGKNGNIIRLPLSGTFDDTLEDLTVDEKVGVYWTSDIYGETTAYIIFIYGSTEDGIDSLASPFHIGIPVRPVSDRVNIAK